MKRVGWAIQYALKRVGSTNLVVVKVHVERVISTNLVVVKVHVEKGQFNELCRGEDTR